MNNIKITQKTYFLGRTDIDLYCEELIEKIEVKKGLTINTFPVFLGKQIDKTHITSHSFDFASCKPLSFHCKTCGCLLLAQLLFIYPTKINRVSGMLRGFSTMLGISLRSSIGRWIIFVSIYALQKKSRNVFRCT